MSSKDTLVFVHGAWDSATTWRKIKPVLEGLGHKVIAIDLPGHGEDTSPIEEQSMETYVQKVIKCIGEIEGKVVLFGHSMGGAIVSNAAEQIPEKIKKLIYIAAFMLPSGWSTNGVDGYGMIPHDWRMGNPHAKLARLPKEVFDIKDKSGVAITNVEPEKSFKEIECVDALFGKVNISNARWGSLPRYYIKTTEDVALPTSKQEEMLKMLPCKGVYEVKSGHVPQLQVPELLLDKIGKILAD